MIIKCLLNKTMDCFEDIIKTNNYFDKTLKTTISRFNEINESTILVTESVNLSASYRLSDGFTPNESWSFPQLNRLSFPAIVSKHTEDGLQYVFAVQEPNSLNKWSFGPQKQRLEKHFFSTKIIGLIGSQTSEELIFPIIVYESGFCQSISNAIETKTEDNKQRIISEDESIQFIDGLIDKKRRDNLIIYLITRNKASTDSTIKSIYRLTLNIRSAEIIKIESQSVVNRLTNWSLCRKSETILSISRFNEEMVVFSMNGETENLLFKLDLSSIESVYSLGTTTAGSVCLIGKTKDNNFAIELWESRYGSKLGAMSLPYEPLTNDCKVIDNKVLIPSLKGIVLVSIKYQTISLSQIVAKNKLKELIPDSELNQQLNQICNQIDVNSEQPLEEITERFTDIVRQISGNIPEDLILKLLVICSEKLKQSNSESLKKFIEKLVSLPFNELFMISKLKASKLKFQQILSILEQLSELLPSNNCAIIDWISILIDSHINQFIMNPSEDTLKVVEQIQFKVENFRTFCEHFGPIKTFFEIILSKNMNKSSKCGAGFIKPQKGQYCIEILRF